MWIRLAYTLFCFGLLLVAPWWLFTFCAVAGIIIFSGYYESWVLGFVYDILFGLEQVGFLMTQFTFLVSFVFVLLLVEVYKKVLYIR